MTEIGSKYSFTIQTLEHKVQLTKKEINSEYSYNAIVPKMPFLDESKDDIDSYLRRFERYATEQKWKEDI